jgi:hypothetical protein
MPRRLGTNIALALSKQTERKYEADLKNYWKEQEAPAD